MGSAKTIADTTANSTTSVSCEHDASNCCHDQIDGFFCGSDGDTKGFSLIELIVVVLVIGIIAAIAIPVFLNAQDNARQAAVEATAASAVGAVQEAVLSGQSEFSGVLDRFSDNDDVELSVLTENFWAGDPDSVCVQAVHSAGNVGLAGAGCDDDSGGSPGDESGEASFAGGEWLQAESPEDAFLISARIEGDRGIAVGRDGVIIVSDDAGETWTEVDTPTEHNLNGLQFDGNHAITAGNRGTILVSEDAGETWTEADEVPDLGTAAFYSLHFEGDRGIAVSNGGVVVVSDDAGYTWREVETPTETNLRSVYFEGNRALIVGSIGNLEQAISLVSDDAGETWEVGTVPSEVTMDSVNMNGSQAIAVNQQGRIWFSEDAGNTWSAAGRPSADSLMSSYIDGNRAIATGNNGTVVVSDNAGRSWRAVSVDTAERLYSVDASGDRAITVGDNGAVFFTEAQ